MPVKLIIFGQLAEITGNPLVVEDIHDTDELVNYLLKKFPALASVKFKIAVNRKLVNKKTVVSENSEIALLPPYSGG